MIGMVRFMSNKILFCTGEGIGNVIQTIPVIRTIKERLGYDIDFWHMFGSFRVPKLIPYVDEWYIDGHLHDDMNQYRGYVTTLWTQAARLPIKRLNTPRPLKMEGESEVDTYMHIARDLGVEEEDLIWSGDCLYNNREEKFDIVLNNGYNPVGSANWKIKSYPHYEELAKLLKNRGYSVCSIGTPQEHIEGTENMTRLPLLDSLGIIKNSKMLICNDSGMYHCANALNKTNITIFTATSIEKNHDRRFHIHSTLIFRDDLSCRPCQATHKWNKDCKTWDCREIKPEYIAGMADNIIGIAGFLSGVKK